MDPGTDIYCLFLRAGRWGNISVSRNIKRISICQFQTLTNGRLFWIHAIVKAVHEGPARFCGDKILFIGHELDQAFSNKLLCVTVSSISKGTGVPFDRAAETFGVSGLELRQRIQTELRPEALEFLRSMSFSPKNTKNLSVTGTDMGFECFKKPSGFTNSSGNGSKSAIVIDDSDPLEFDHQSGPAKRQRRPKKPRAMPTSNDTPVDPSGLEPLLPRPTRMKSFGSQPLLSASTGQQNSSEVTQLRIDNTRLAVSLAKSEAERQGEQARYIDLQDRRQGELALEVMHKKELAQVTAAHMHDLRSFSGFNGARQQALSTQHYPLPFLPQTSYPPPAAGPQFFPPHIDPHAYPHAYPPAHSYQAGIPQQFHGFMPPPTAQPFTTLGACQPKLEVASKSAFQLNTEISHLYEALGTLPQNSPLEQNLMTQIHALEGQLRAMNR